jgi:hypothetical protein
VDTSINSGGVKTSFKFYLPPPFHTHKYKKKKEKRREKKRWLINVQ